MEGQVQKQPPNQNTFLSRMISVSPADATTAVPAGATATALASALATTPKGNEAGQARNLCGETRCFLDFKELFGKEPTRKPPNERERTAKPWDCDRLIHCAQAHRRSGDE